MVRTNVAYKIVEVQDEFGNIKENRWKDMPFIISNAYIDGSCVLTSMSGDGYIATGRVEKIEIMDNEIYITTVNSRYAIKAVNING